MKKLPNAVKWLIIVVVLALMGWMLVKVNEPRLPREDAGTGQQSGHLPESRCLKRATLSVIPKQ